jgi:hypothetical protein
MKGGVVRTNSCAILCGKPLKTAQKRPAGFKSEARQRGISKKLREKQFAT